MERNYRRMTSIIDDSCVLRNFRFVVDTDDTRI